MYMKYSRTTGKVRAFHAADAQLILEDGRVLSTEVIPPRQFHEGMLLEVWERGGIAMLIRDLHAHEFEALTARIASQNFD